MAFKQNIPVLAFIVAVAAAGVAFLIFIQPSEEDLTRAHERAIVEAAQAYVKDKGGTNNVTVFGDTAFVLLPDGRALHLEFKLKDGKWLFGKDLWEEFQKTASDPAVEAEILGRLAKRLQDRYRTEVSFKEGMRKSTTLERQEHALVGTVELHCSIPSGGGRHGLRYAETFRYEGGQWIADRVGILLDQVGSK